MCITSAEWRTVLRTSCAGHMLSGASGAGLVAAVCPAHSAGNFLVSPKQAFGGIEGLRLTFGRGGLARSVIRRGRSGAGRRLCVIVRRLPLCLRNQRFCCGKCLEKLQQSRIFRK